MLEPEDVDDELMAIVQDEIEARYPGRVDWHELWDTLERTHGYNMGPTTGSPAMQLIQQKWRAMSR